MSEERVVTSRDSRGVVTVAFNRPDVANAYDQQMLEELLATFDALVGDETARVVVVRGHGRHFQAGADLDWALASRDKGVAANEAVSRLTTRAIDGLMMFPKPTVALVQGGCFGGGMGIAAASDVVIAAYDAIFALTEARWGLVAIPIIPQLIARLGPARAKRYLMTCERFDGQRAVELGFADEACPAERLDETAAPIIDALLQAAPDAVSQSKAFALKYAALYLTAMDIEDIVRPHAAKLRSEEAEEGLLSFQERRAARWYPGGAG